MDLEFLGTKMNIETLLLSEKNNILTIMLNDPKTKNALNKSMILELTHTFKSISDKTHYRVVF